MKSLGVASAKGGALMGAVLDDPQLVKRREDDPRGGAELGLENLDHRGLPVTDFQHAAAGAGRRVVDVLGQLDDIEFGDLSNNGHADMLEARIGGDQPRSGSFVLVVPTERRERTALADRQLNLEAADHAEWRTVTDLQDPRSGRRADDRRPESRAPRGRPERRPPTRDRARPRSGSIRASFSHHASAARGSGCPIFGGHPISRAPYRPLLGGHRMKPIHFPDRIRPSSSRTQGGRQGERTSVRDPQTADRGQRDAKRRMRSGALAVAAPPPSPRSACSPPRPSPPSRSPITSAPMTTTATPAPAAS